MKALSTNGTTGSSPSRSVTGQHIAKAYVTYGPRQRANDAALWLLGRLRIKPTLKLAARTFEVSVPLVVEAREYLARLDEQRKHNGHDGVRHTFPRLTETKPTLAEHLVSASLSERIEAARAVGVDIVWDTMVLPLVGNGKAAE